MLQDPGEPKNQLKANHPAYPFPCTDINDRVVLDLLHDGDKTYPVYTFLRAGASRRRHKASRFSPYSHLRSPPN